MRQPCAQGELRSLGKNTDAGLKALDPLTASSSFGHVGDGGSWTGCPSTLGSTGSIVTNQPGLMNHKSNTGNPRPRRSQTEQGRAGMLKRMNNEIDRRKPANAKHYALNGLLRYPGEQTNRRRRFS